MENSPRKFEAVIRSSLRYNLTQKLMEENFLKWLSLPTTMNLTTKLIEDCKKKTISLNTPSPIFVTKVNPLTTSQTLSQLNQHFMPPVSPNSAAFANYQTEKKNMLTESQILSKKLTESTTSINHNLQGNSGKHIPQFYFPKGNPEANKEEDTSIKKIFNNRSHITMDEFVPITEELLGFPKMFNCVLYDKIPKTTSKVSKEEFISFNDKHFKGKSECRKFFNFIKNPNTQGGYILPNDFRPFLKALLEQHPGLEFLKAHPTFQEKYTETVIMRIYYTCDLNDDGKLNFREFKKSNLVTVLKKVCEEPDINLIREYFSYEHFYVIYCIFWDLDTSETENDLLLDKEDFSKYDGHSLSRKAVDRIFAQVPRKFKSGQKDKMGFEDFVWYLLSEEDKTTRSSIEYWFKVIDLDDNGIITPHEMKYFYDEQVHRMDYLQHEVVQFNDVLCQLHDMIKPEREHQWTLANFLNNRTYASVFFNNLLNLNKFLANEQKDPFARNEIDKNQELSDWDKFACIEYQRKINEENEDNCDEEGAFIDSNSNDEKFDNEDGMLSNDSGAEK